MAFALAALACLTCLPAAASQIFVPGGAQQTSRGDANYSVLSTDRVVVTTASLSAARTWTLPAANSVAAGQSIYVLDMAGGVTLTNTLTIQRAGSDTIEGSTSLVLNAAYSTAEFKSDGTSKWSSVMSQIPKSCAAHNYVISYTKTGGIGCGTVSSSDVSGLAASATTDTTNASNIASGTENIEIRKAGDLALASDQTFVTTTRTSIFTYTIAAGETYGFEAVLYFNADATGGHAWNMSGSATVSGTIYEIVALCDASSAQVISSRETALGSGGVAFQAACTQGVTRISGTVTTTGAGSLNVQGSEHAATGTLTVKAGSYVRLWRIS